MPYDPSQPRDECGRWCNTPGRPYVGKKSVAEMRRMTDANGYISAGYDKGSHHCVPLVKAIIPELGNTGEWQKGPDINGPDDPNLRPGTAIGKGFDDQGNYPNKMTGNHVAIYLGPATEAGKINVYDQWKGQRAHQHAVDPKGWSIVTRKN